MTATSSENDPGSRWRTLALVAPALLFVLLYARSLPFEFVWTDQTEIEQGLLIRPPGEMVHALVEPMYRDHAALDRSAVQPYYRPVKVVVASAIDAVFGREAPAFRALNLALGAATFALFSALALQLLGDPRAAALVASVAALHPAAIENHVWPSGLDDALAKFFVVACLWATLRTAAAPARARTAWGGVSLLLLLLGLGSKESALVTPALAVACLLVAPTRQGPPGASLRAARWWVGGQIALAASFFLLLRPAVLGGFAAGTPPIAGRYAVHLLSVVATWPDRIAWLFLPLSSTTSDVVPVVMVVLTPSFVAGALLGLSAPYLVWRFWRAGLHIEALAWAWIWIAFLPTSGLVPLAHVRAERHLALPALGAAFFAWTAVRVVAARLHDPRLRAAVAAVLSLAIVTGLAERSYRRIGDWRSDLVLFGRDVERDPFYREGRYVLAAALAERGRYEEARDQLLELASVNDRFGMRASFVRQESASQLLCEVDLELGRADETLRLFGTHLRPDSSALAAAPAFFLCGARSLEQVGRDSEAREIYLALHALPRVGGDARVQLGLARVELALGNVRAAASWLARTPESLPGDPGFEEARRRLRARLEAR